MSLEYQIRFPLSPEVTETNIKAAAAEWIEGSKWYRFTETHFPPEEQEGTLIQVGEGRTVWFKHFEYRPEETGSDIFYYGYRLETTDPENRKWRAEAVFELGGEQTWMYIKNACYVNDIQKPSKISGSYRYPRIIRVMLEKSFLADDKGFAIGQTHQVSKLTENERKLLQKTMQDQSRLELPILCIHARGSQNWKETIRTITADYLNRTAHVFLCMDEAEDESWKDICSCCEWISDIPSEPSESKISTFELIVPQTGTCCRHYFEEKEKDYSLVDQVMDAITLAGPCQQADSPDWNWLHLQNTVVPQSSNAESYYCIMNEAMASRLQEARKQHGMTQKNLADKVGCQMMLISRLERLQTRKVKREQVYEIERALGLERNELARLTASKDKEEKSSRSRSNMESPAGTKENTDGAPSPDDNLTEEKQVAHFCHMCGTPLKPESRFCHNCGVRIIRD